MSPTLEAQTPANDNCANAINLTVDGGCTNGTTNGATLEGGESLGCFSSGGGCNPTQTTWYSFNTGSNTSLWLDLDQTNASNCAGGYAVYGPNPTCQPTAGDRIICQNTLPTLGGTELTGLSPNSTYYIQVMGRNGGGGNDRFMDFCIGMETPTNCNTCSNPCGAACGYATAPTVTQVTSTCPPNNLAPHISSGSHTYCYTFTAVSTTVDFQIIISGTGCTFGNIVSMNWSVYNQGSCGAPLFSANFPNLTMGGLTIGSSYTFCYTMVPSCTHLAHYPYFVGAAPLPLTLHSFEGIPLADHNRLEWVTDMESNWDYYIERSSDGINFETLGAVAAGEHVNKAPAEATSSTRIMLMSDGKSGSTLKQARLFRYEDRDAPPAKAFYRLRQMQVDGEEEYSSVVEVIRKSEWLQVQGPWPIPAHEQAQLAVALGEPGVAEITIRDISGKKLQAHRLEIQHQQKTLALNTQQLAPGLYFVEVQSGNYKKVLRLSVQ